MIRALAFALALIATPASAQAYAPPDRELWEAMVRAFGEINATATAHQRMQQIFADVQREAQLRAARDKAVQQAPKE